MILSEFAYCDYHEAMLRIPYYVAKIWKPAFGNWVVFGSNYCNIRTYVYNSFSKLHYKAKIEVLLMLPMATIYDWLKIYMFATWYS